MLAAATVFPVVDFYCSTLLRNLWYFLFPSFLPSFLPSNLEVFPPDWLMSEPPVPPVLEQVPSDQRYSSIESMLKTMSIRNAS